MAFDIEIDGPSPSGFDINIGAPFVPRPPPPPMPRSGGGRRSARRPAFFGPVTTPPPPPPAPTFAAAVRPAVVKRSPGPARSARMQAFFGPVDKPFNPVTNQGANPVVQQQRPMVHRSRSRFRRAYFGPTLLIANPTVTPITPAGVLTLAPNVQARSSVTMSWVTDVMKAWSGLEQRRPANRWPRLRFDFVAALSDAQQRAILSSLAGSAQAAPIYSLALAFEDLTIKSNAVGTAIQVHSLARCDWAQSGRRIVVVHPNGTAVDGLIQLAAGDTITTTTDLSATAVEGARIMAAHPVHLEPNQKFDRQLTARSDWHLTAFAERPFAVPLMGVGATVNTHDGIPVWDVGIPLAVARQPLRSGTELADYGSRISAVANWTQSDWERALAVESSKVADWQWLKAFLDAVRGQQMPFLLPTGRPDLVPLGDASGGTLLVEGTPAAGYVTGWFPSLAHRRLRLLKTDNTFAYRTVSGAIDNGNGTQTLTLASALTGSLARVELLETCRLDRDEVTVTFDGPRFSSSIAASVVQR
jgi:hypothetical protein